MGGSPSLLAGEESVEVTNRRSDGILGPDLVVHGRLEGKSDLRIEGVFEGVVHLDGELTVGPGARVRAPLEVGQLQLEGELVGGVRARESVAIRAGGRLIGDVSAPRVAIDDGASLQGGVDMDFDLPGLS